jgi:hypothetical protein
MAWCSVKAQGQLYLTLHKRIKRSIFKYKVPILYFSSLLMLSTAYTNVAAKLIGLTSTYGNAREKDYLALIYIRLQYIK